MRRGQLERRVALDVAKHDIAARIRGVCTNFTENDFAALVERMAEIDVRYRLKEDWTFSGEATMTLAAH
jgi:extradiol dioxygenase family protein